jgi:excinuclease ABC subunit C
MYGPFTSSQQLREALKIVRKIFPFFDCSFPVDAELSSSQKKHLSFNQSIGLYPRELNTAGYTKTVRYIISFFDGKKPSLVKTLNKEMEKAANEERFEDANTLKRQIFSLEHIRDLTLIKDEYKRPQSAMYRIEAYDIAHNKGEATRGVMTVVVDGEKSPKDYRTFTIRTAVSGDDIAALTEVIERRAKHREWSYPQLIVIDGGATHLKHAKHILKYVGIDADVVSVVKDDRHKPKNILGTSTSRHTHENSILLANAEAHRYAIGRHRYAMRKNRGATLRSRGKLG